MEFPATIKKKLFECCKKIFEYSTIQTFSSKYEQELGITYDNATVGGPNGWDDRLMLYLDSLKQKGSLPSLVECLRTDAGFNSRSVVTEFLVAYDEVFVLKQGKIEIQESFFRKTLLRNVLPFVGRQSIVEKMQLVVNDKNKLMLIDGEEKSGITYLSYYFSEIAQEIECADFIHIELIKIKHEYANGSLIEPKHLTQYFYDKLGITGFNTDAIKFTQFSTQIKEALNARKNYTFFFVDQFQYLLSNDGKSWIKDLAQESIKSNYRCYFVIGGKKLLQEWSGEIKYLAKRVMLGYGTFTREQVVAFFQDLYQILAKTYDFELTENEFVDKFISIIPSTLYTVGPDKTNVPEIGEQLAEWYNGFLEEINKDN